MTNDEIRYLIEQMMNNAANRYNGWLKTDETAKAIFKCAYLTTTLEELAETIPEVLENIQETIAIQEGLKNENVSASS